MVSQVRSRVCSQPAPSAMSVWRSLTWGWGVHIDPWETPVRQWGGGPEWRRPGYLSHAPPGRESSKAVLPQGVEGAGRIAIPAGRRQAARRGVRPSRARPIDYPSNRAARPRHGGFPPAPEGARAPNEGIIQFKSQAQVQRFLSVPSPIQHLFRTARPRLKAIHHRLLRHQACTTWETATWMPVLGPLDHLKSKFVTDFGNWAAPGRHLQRP